LDKVKPCFDELYNLYDEIQDSFRVDFHGFKKDVFIDYLTEEDQEQYWG
jgi:antirestriction protein